MEIQKLLWILLILMLVAMSFIAYFRNHSKWTDCPYPLDLFQLVIISLISLSLILSILSFILFGMQRALRLRNIFTVTAFILQSINVILYMTETVLTCLTLHSHKDCVIYMQLPMETHAILISLIAALLYWFFACGISTMSVRNIKAVAYFLDYRRFNVLGDIGEQNVNGLNQVQISLIATMEAKEDVVCSICLENIQQGTLAKVIPGCEHKFHEPCILPWLVSNSICPYCKRSIVVEIN